MDKMILFVCHGWRNAHVAETRLNTPRVLGVAAKSCRTISPSFSCSHVQVSSLRLPFRSRSSLCLLAPSLSPSTRGSAWCCPSCLSVSSAFSSRPTAHSLNQSLRAHLHFSHGFGVVSWIVLAERSHGREPKSTLSLSSQCPEPSRGH